MKTDSICIVEVLGYDSPVIHTFFNDVQGRIEARLLFATLALQQGEYAFETCTQDEITDGIEQGFLDNARAGSDRWALFIQESHR